jgi:hypothetical protein
MEVFMKGQVVMAACLSAGVALVGCGGGSSVSSASLQPRLLPASSTPGFGVQRTLDWSDPVNLVGEGLFLPQATHPSAAVAEFKGAHFKGSAGEVLTNGPANGPGSNGVEVRVGVAQFSSGTDANRVRDWMHRQDLHQPCFSQCIFAPGSVTVPGVPTLRFVVQSSHVPPPPKGVGIPAGVRVASAPTNYLAEFTVGPYLYWIILQGDSSAKAQFEEGIKLYYAHAKQTA